MRAWLALAPALALAACNPQGAPGGNSASNNDLGDQIFPQKKPAHSLMTPEDPPIGSQAAALLEELPAATTGYLDTPANQARLNAFVRGALQFVLLHETGHFVMSSYRIINPGGAETAADRFAAFFMTPEKRPPGQPAELLDPAAGDDAPPILWATALWRQEQRNLEKSGDPLDWSDEHGLPEQRLRQVLCLLYGADPDRWIQQQTFASALSLEKREFCREDTAQNNAVWGQMIVPHIDPSAPAESRFNPRVVYATAPPELDGYKSWLTASGLLEAAASDIRLLKLPDGAGPDEAQLTVIGSACPSAGGGFEINAMWQADKGALTLCYGLIKLFESEAITALGNMPRATQERPQKGN